MKSLGVFCSQSKSANMVFVGTLCSRWINESLKRPGYSLNTTIPLETVARIWNQLIWQNLYMFSLMNINSQVGKTDHYLGCEQQHIVSERTSFSNYPSEQNMSDTETSCRRS